MTDGSDEIMRWFDVLGLPGLPATVSTVTNEHSLFALPFAPFSEVFDLVRVAVRDHLRGFISLGFY